ncbi:AraC family transcriptional regulator [Paenibacillus sp. LS1]|uniref:AraC family transcriptional regulator n=1 Tax=Paenibacillus sp. LS1 TaxID=2992120 RepID=UPI0022314F6E|nr:helix-turn-helix domain-containing protein [Paenibacillus sp. LS1]MCW3791531.1 AraC family transcriptional regulator [Paenibacillus sp. LS1]
MKEWSEAIQWWNKNQVKLMDIRHLVLKPGQVLKPYVLPAHAFLLMFRGEAIVHFGKEKLRATQTQVLHGGKGTTLHIQCLDIPLEYYLILYKPQPSFAGTHPSRADNVQQEYEFCTQQYHFAATYPLSLIPIMERMHECWASGEELDRLQVTGLLYQFVYEQFRQWKLAGEQVVEPPELTEQIAAYIQEHYAHPVSMEDMAAQFHYSSHYLARVFKRKFGCSPMEYVIQTRMNRAKVLLTETDAQIRDVAESVGYKDLYYFSRIFKRMMGETPAQYKMHSHLLKGSNRTNKKSESFIAGELAQRYIDNNDNHYQYNTWSVNDLNVRFKPTLAVSLLFSLSLLLAACGGGADPQPTANEDASLPATKMYTDASGRTVEIPAQSAKPVVITYGGYLLPLGMKPAGANKETLDLYPEEMADVSDIGSGTGNVEVVSDLEPDLIIVPDYTSTEVIGTYEKIAPTITVAWGGDPDVINTLRTMGEIMDRKEEAEKWIAAFEDKLKGIRDELNINIEPGTTAMSFVIYNKEVLLGGEGGTLGKLIYQDFGFDMPEQYKAYADGGTVLSLEKLADKPADYFFTQMDDEEMEQMMELFKEPVYQSIPAIKNHRIINVSRNYWNYGPYLVDKGLDSLIEQVSKLQE